MKGCRLSRMCYTRKARSMEGTLVKARAMARILTAGLVLCSLFACRLAAAQVTPESYRLRPEDSIIVTVYNESQVQAIPVTILPDGRASIQFAGTLEVAGKTTSELEAELKPIYEKRFKLKEALVSVTINRYRPIRAGISGQVLNPGYFQDFRPGDTLMNLITRGGGAAIERRANIKRSMLIRGTSQEVIPIDLEALLYRGDTSQNYPIEDGDTLMVPAAENPVILVQGAVVRPGTFEYPMIGEYRLTDAISMAQGGIPNRAKMSEILVFRRNPSNPNSPIVYKANYVRLIDKRDFSQDIILQPNDLVYVTQTKTPDVNQISSILNALFFVDRFFTGGLLGFRF